MISSQQRSSAIKIERSSKRIYLYRRARQKRRKNARCTSLVYPHTIFYSPRVFNVYTSSLNVFLYIVYRASLKLAYKDLSLEDARREKEAKNLDPRKAAQFERLGMGYASSSGSRDISHSVFSDMQTIEQEAPASSGRGRFDDAGFRSSSRPIDDEFEILGEPSK